MRTVKLSKPEIEIIRHALYMLREYHRNQERVDRDNGRERGRSSAVINLTLKLDSTLSDASDAALADCAR